jgi:hypothetical protein
MDCKTCGAPASLEYDDRGSATPVCEVCFDFHEIESAFHTGLLEVEGLSGSRQFAAAHDVLQRIWDTNSHRDRTGWLQWAVLTQQAIILANAGRLDEALERHRAIPRESFQGKSDMMMINSKGIANILARKGEMEQALAVLEEALVASATDCPPLALSLVHRYAEIAEENDRPIPVRYWAYLDMAADYYGIPESRVEGSNVLASSQLLKEKLAAAQERYEVLISRLKSTGAAGTDVKTETELIEKFIANEPIRFYRELVSKWLTVG